MGLPAGTIKPLPSKVSPLHKDEVVLLQTGRGDLVHPQSLVGLILLGVFIPFFFWVRFLQREEPVLASFLTGLIVFLAIVETVYFLSWYGYRRRRITVTSARTIYEHGNFRGRVTEIAHNSQVVAVELVDGSRTNVNITSPDRELDILGVRESYIICRLINALATDSIPIPDILPTSSAPKPKTPPPLPPRSPNA